MEKIHKYLSYSRCVSCHDSTTFLEYKLYHSNKTVFVNRALTIKLHNYLHTPRCLLECEYINDVDFTKKTDINLKIEIFV